MKKFLLFRPFVFAAASLLFVSAGLAQMPGMSSSFTAMMKLLRDSKTFTSDAEFSSSDTNGVQTMSMPMVIVQQNEKLRMEMDMDKIKGGAFPPQFLPRMKEMGMTRNIMLMSTGSTNMTVIFPDLTSYIQSAMPKELMEALTNDTKMDKADLGKDTVDGHACLKSKFTFTSDNGKKQEVLVWNATDLKNFPVKMQFPSNIGGETIAFKNVRLAKPDAKMFEPPTDYTKCANQQELQQKAMARAAASGAKP
jgi:hypothetical protein